MDIDLIRQLADMAAASKNTVFFGGAGVSTESGIPDFRSAQGLFQEKSRIPPEEIISRSFFMSHPEAFYEFYKQKMVYPQARPNTCHKALARLEGMGRLRAVITQNIDGLHQAAGSREVLELHGSVHRNFCMRCGKATILDQVMESPGVPHCGCGGIIKPDVVLYEETLDGDVTQRATEAIAQSELMIIGGTSLTVYPAASFVSLCKGKVVIINKSPTMMDRSADLVIAAPIGEVFAALMPLIEAAPATNP
ncbi:MAG: NAD-dependent protein deacylase [Eubacteriales bacterium]|nr:NAD-dependent protein deacylase [Eubacteriales bacterium]